MKITLLWFSHNSPGLSNIQSPRGTVTVPPWTRGVPAWSGGGCLVPGGTSLVPGGFLPGPGGVSGPGRVPAWSGGCLVRHSPPVNRMTHTCKNITLAKTSFRPVKILLLKFRCLKSLQTTAEKFRKHHNSLADKDGGARVCVGGSTTSHIFTKRQKLCSVNKPETETYIFHAHSFPSLQIPGIPGSASAIGKHEINIIGGSRGGGANSFIFIQF